MSTKYNLNHIYVTPIGNEAVVIGADQSIEIVELTLFEKSLALTSDLKRLPIIRGITIQLVPEATFCGYSNTCGVPGVKAECLVYNKTFTEAEIEAIFAANEQYDNKNDLLWCDHLLVQYILASSVLSITRNNAVWPFRGGVLADNVMTIALDLHMSGNVSTSDFPADEIKAIVFCEVDWVPISSKEFQEYILENVYAED
jgi:hypothetical protein